MADNPFSQFRQPLPRENPFARFRHQAEAVVTPQPQEGLGRTVLDQGLQGATFGFADEITDRIGAGIAALATDESYDSLLNEARGESQARMQRQMEQRPGASIAANLAGGLLTGGAGASTKAGTAVANSLRAGGTVARIGKGAAAGAATGAAYGAGSAREGERLSGAGEGAIIGGLVGGAVPVAGAAYQGVKNTVLPQVDDATAELARQARGMDIPLRVDQVAPSRVRNTLQKVSQEIPFSGAAGQEERQIAAFNRSLAGTIGQKADDLGPETINRFLSDASKKFQGALANKTISFGDESIGAIRQIAANAADDVTGDIASLVGKNVQKVLGDVQSGIVSGEKLSSLRSDLVKRLPKIDSKARPYVTEMIDIIDDAIEKSAPETVDVLREARRQWRNFKTIEPLLEKSADGRVNPTLLMQRVASSPYIKASRAAVGEDDLVDLARIGKQFLPQKGGSDTAQKLATIGAAGGGVTGLVTAPAATLAAAPKVAAALLANRTFQQGYNANQRIVDALLSRAPQSVNPLLSKAQAAAIPSNVAIGNALLNRR